MPSCSSVSYPSLLILTFLLTLKLVVVFLILTVFITGCSVKKVEELKGDGTEKIVSLELEKAEILKMIKESDVKTLGINDSGSKLAFLTYLWKEKDDNNE